RKAEKPLPPASKAEKPLPPASKAEKPLPPASKAEKPLPPASKDRRSSTHSQFPDRPDSRPRRPRSVRFNA
ncbi:hypothetical protein ACIA5C_34630, partial [Actinoplanes sp. NPDC051343]|uniref:hypothetical protein n=1 Tax=Actinoplanes sp. NPDC051343 TaxID=3363906 RepID=UPI003789D921